MGLLDGVFLGLAGAAGSAGKTAAEGIMEEEKQRALDTRERSLAELRQKLSDDSFVKQNAITNGQALSANYDPDTLRQLTNSESSEYDPDTLIGKHQAEQMATIAPDTRIDGRPATYQQLADNAEANKQMGLIRQQMDNRVDPAAVRAVVSDGNLLRTGPLDQAYNSVQMTPEEQEVADSYKGDAGKISSDKMDREILALQEKQYAAELRSADNRLSAQERAAARKDASDTRVLIASIVSDSHKYQADTKAMTPTEGKDLESRKKTAKEKASDQANSEAESMDSKKPHVWTSEKTVYGGIDRDKWVSNRTKELAEQFTQEVDDNRPARLQRQQPSKTKNPVYDPKTGTLE